MVRRPASVQTLAALAGVAALLLQGCGKQETTTTTTTTTAATTTATTTTASTSSTSTLPGTAHCATSGPDGACNGCEDGFELNNTICHYACQTDMAPVEIVKPEQKGLCLDDTTFNYCADWIPHRWPNAGAQMTSLRIFSAWQGFWPDEGRQEAWGNLVRFVKSKNARVLVGTQITCNETDDDRDWNNVKSLMQMMGPEHVMGIAFGNEMELLYTKDYVRADKECLPRMWKGGYFWRKTAERVADLDAMAGGFEKIPLTSVFGGYALAGNPFVEQPLAMVNSYLTNATKTFGTRWAFTLNIYPYFDPSNHMDSHSSTTCEDSIRLGTCFNDLRCNLIGTVFSMRLKTKQLTGRTDDTLWVGETGWSYPQASTLNTAVARCANFSSRATFETYYRNFLKWDLSIVPGIKGPDHVFFFTIRDSVNFGLEEHFGLIGQCQETQCKLQTDTGSSTTTTASGSTTAEGLEIAV